MSKYLRAEVVFRHFPEELKGVILKTAKGKLVDFRGNRNQKKVNEIILFKKYDDGDSYRNIAKNLGCSRQHIKRIVRQERQMLSKERIQYWQNQGLSTLGIMALFNIKSRRKYEKYLNGNS